MARDGGLRAIFRRKLPTFHWVSIETGSTSRGVPDSNYCTRDGREGWIEYKQSKTSAVRLRPEQIGWMLRRTRSGGRAFIAVRYKHVGGPRKGPPVDELWLFNGANAARVRGAGIDGASVCECFGDGGPAGWQWDRVKDLLSS